MSTSGKGPNFTLLVQVGHSGEITPLAMALSNDWWLPVHCCVPEVPRGTEPQFPRVGTSLTKPCSPAAFPSLSYSISLPSWHLLGSLPQKNQFAVEFLSQNTIFVFVLESLHYSLLLGKGYQDTAVTPPTPTSLLLCSFLTKKEPEA